MRFHLSICMGSANIKLHCVHLHRIVDHFIGSVLRVYAHLNHLGKGFAKHLHCNAVVPAVHDNAATVLHLLCAAWLNCLCLCLSQKSSPAHHCSHIIHFDCCNNRIGILCRAQAPLRQICSE